MASGGAAAGRFSVWFRQMLMKEPVIVYSCIIGAVGVAIPFVAIPMRGAEWPTAHVPGHTRPHNRNFKSWDERNPVAGLDVSQPRGWKGKLPNQ